jgi:DNA/RNA-binding domain of Phe-tRNA-synthetase-like protein
MSDDGPDLRRGLVAPAVAAEHPGLRLVWTDVECRPGRSSPELRERLRAMADRMAGAQAIELRRREVPHLHRVFFRHIGLDPDVVRVPAEAIALRRMREGGLRSQGCVDDALTVAVMETGVGVWAFDAAGVVGAPEVREEERLVLADESGPLSVLFGEPLPRAAVTRQTQRVALIAVGVPNVPELFVDEALWTAWDVLTAH